MQYKLISSGLLKTFNETVNAHLKDGWRLYGHPQVALAGSAEEWDQTYIQAVVKE